jgi:hypothetical protein
MNAATKQALITFSAAVSAAISRSACGKDVDWREVVAANRELEYAIRLEPDTPQDTPARITERPLKFTKVHTEPAAIRPNVSAGTP